MRSVLSSAPEGSNERVRLAESTASLRILLIAGAPVSRALLRDVVACWPTCDVRTPYGMTEVLPATDVGAAEVLAESAGLGVLVGRPLSGVDVAIAPLGLDGVPADQLTDQPDVLGEVAIRAPHAKSRYDGRAFDEQRSGRNPGWHRTGDIGRLDGNSRLWVNGRLSHVITASNGPVGPVEVEQRIEVEFARTGDGDITVAAVGVGPVGTQVIVVVCAPQRSGSGDDRIALASLELTERVRAIEPAAAAVLWRGKMPVDIRHGAKVDRSALAREAARILAGHR
jgi:acyl-CoA synthetase (AMP-forming)/AMP-acid ligase II